MTGDSLTVLREALENCSRWTAQEAYRYTERDKGLAALTDVEALIESLRWIEDFATKMRDRHTGYVHVERRARAALARFPATSPAKEQT